MNPKFTKKLLAASLVAVSSGAIMPAVAQSSGGHTMALEEVVVTARRREESLQDVPLTVNAVTAEQLDNLGIRKLEDLQSAVPGLTMQNDTIAPNASMRGVRYDTFVSGNSATVEFYQNDAPISSAVAMQALFDVSQIEVLRGPQGTLRGKASPSGSIIITTQQPILDEIGGYIDATVANRDTQIYRGAFNLPIVENVLAARVAGFWEERDPTNIEQVYNGDQAEYDSNGYRMSLRYEPLDTLTFDLTYQRIKPDQRNYNQVESANLANPGLAPSDPFISKNDRYGVQDIPEVTHQDQRRTSFQAAWEVYGQQLNYVFSDTKQITKRVQPIDFTNAIYEGYSSPVYPPATANAWQELAQDLNSVQNSNSHELRLQSVDPLFDQIDYVLGFFYNRNKPGNALINYTPLAGFSQVAPGFYFGPVAYIGSATDITTGSESKETSYFANLTWHITDSLELSGGARQIDYENDDSGIYTCTGAGCGYVVAPHKMNESKTIYTGSVKYSFSDELMTYFTYGSSWRPPISVVGDFSAQQSPLELAFTNWGAETSDSFELGFKSTWLDDRLRFNADVYYQEFDNYPYRSGGNGIYYVSYGRDGAPVVDQFNFGAPVQVHVTGFELESFFQATENWNVGALFSYSKSEIQDDLIPCNDYDPHDGNPDTTGFVPTVDDILAVAPVDHLTSCTSDDRANYAPLWTATLQSQYDFMLGGMEAYVRGLWNIYGDSKNDPSNAIDDVDSYTILNLYAGVRDPAGAWEAMIYSKNIFDKKEYVSRNADPGSVGYVALDVGTFAPIPALSDNVISDYRQIQLIAPREIGVNFKYNFSF